MVSSADARTDMDVRGAEDEAGADISDVVDDGFEIDYANNSIPYQACMHCCDSGPIHYDRMSLCRIRSRRHARLVLGEVEGVYWTNMPAYYTRDDGERMISTGECFGGSHKLEVEVRDRSGELVRIRFGGAHHQFNPRPSPRGLSNARAIEAPVTLWLEGREPDAAARYGEWYGEYMREFLGDLEDVLIGPIVRGQTIGFWVSRVERLDVLAAEIMFSFDAHGHAFTQRQACYSYAFEGFTDAEIVDYFSEIEASCEPNSPLEPWSFEQFTVPCQRWADAP